MAALRALFLTRRFYAALAAVTFLFALAHAVTWLAAPARVALVAFTVLVVLDALMLFGVRSGVVAEREMANRLSNGDPNVIRLSVTQQYRFPIRATLIDELPLQFQQRGATYIRTLPPGALRYVRYTVRPVRRGVYRFGAVLVYVASPLRLLQRRYRFAEQARSVPVYPSFLQMRQYELLALSDRLEEVGVKKVRRVGHTMEFDHVRDYVLGDDPRTINWKATARRGELMVNQYREERAQPVYCVVDMGRAMKLPFEGMTLLDYSVNASLVLSNIALLKGDRAGLVTFANEIDTTVPAERRPRHIYRLQEALYHIETDFLESDHARLAVHLRRTLRQRSLVILFTNITTRSALQRRLPYLRAIARRNVLVVVFFENTELRQVLDARPDNTEGIYVKATAEKFVWEQRAVVEELRRHGVYTVLTPPKSLTANTINQYLALKARGVF